LTALGCGVTTSVEAVKAHVHITVMIGNGRNYMVKKKLLFPVTKTHSRSSARIPSTVTFSLPPSQPPDSPHIHPHTQMLGKTHLTAAVTTLTAPVGAAARDDLAVAAAPTVAGV